MLLLASRLLLIASLLLPTVTAVCCLPFHERTETGPPAEKCPDGPDGPDNPTKWTCCYGDDRTAQICTNDYYFRYPRWYLEGQDNCHKDTTYDPPRENGFWACIYNPYG